MEEQLDDVFGNVKQKIEIDTEKFITAITAKSKLESMSVQDLRGKLASVMSLVARAEDLLRKSEETGY